MADYWVSNKKYFCKYCDIYIADDKPSRTQHESGLRHKGNRERFVRDLYKKGERAKKDLEEEKREMARVEAAADAAYAQDISSGRAAASSSSRAAQAAPSAPAHKKPDRPTSVFSNYSTAQSLGYTDPDEEHMKAELERRRTQGVVGDWEVVAPPPPPLPGQEQAEGDVKEGIVDGSVQLKRAADPSGDTADDEDGRHFKLRKRTLGAGFDNIWDPGDISIKLKSSHKVESSSPALDGPKETNSAVTSSFSKSTGTGQSQTASETPKWKPMGWKRAAAPASTDAIEVGTEHERKETPRGLDDLPVKQATQPSFELSSASHLALDQSNGQQPSHQEEEKRQLQIAGADETVSVKPEIKEEEKLATLGQEPAGGLFRKRKVPSGVRGRR